MRDESDVRVETCFLLSRVAHVVERIGLAMSGAMCGTFVAACLARASIEMFDSIGFIMSMILIGIIGFYLGIDIPRQRARHVSCGVKRSRLRVDPVELLSATGTFLAAVAALTSVYALVFDEVLQRIWEFVIGFWWLLGAIMQIGAGAIGRMRAWPTRPPDDDRHEAELLRAVGPEAGAVGSPDHGDGYRCAPPILRAARLCDYPTGKSPASRDFPSIPFGKNISVFPK